ncbi:MAG: TAXI family TRAP transporter solute-binding subunit [Deltaproteobacteria bacterium]|nr:TAXI family TRAP transporter solute-binding subunit [Deltaproteobacteria bacterium]
MEIRMKRVAGSVLLVAFTLLFAASAGAQEKLSFSIVTGGTGGVWYPLGGAIGGVIGKYVPNTEATAEATTAAIDNMKLLTAGKAGMAFAYDYHVGWANDGKVPGLAGRHNIRMVMGFYEQPLHVVTTAATGIKNLMQLKGKRVSVGAPNSGTEEQADYVLKALGIDWNKDLKKEKLGAGESVAALKDGKIDAFFWSGAVPTAAIIDMASTPGTKMVLLPVGGKEAEAVMKGNPGVFHKSKFAKGSYASVDRDVDALAITAVLQAMDGFPAEKVYLILKAIFDHKAELAAVWKGAATLTPAMAVGQVTPDALKYLHPGAQKFFTEKGALKAPAAAKKAAVKKKESAKQTEPAKK